jgi:hypothetical protein
MSGVYAAQQKQNWPELPADGAIPRSLLCKNIFGKDGK